MLVLQADRLAAIVAELWPHGVERAALVTKRFARRQWIDLNSRAAILAVSAQVVKPFKPAALALPVADLKLDEVQGSGAAKIGDRKN